MSVITPIYGNVFRAPTLHRVVSDKTGQHYSGNALFGRMRLPTDPTGVFTLTLTNVVAGSRIHVEKQSDGTEYYDGVAASSTVEITLNTYAVGSANNDLRIKVRKATGSPAYKPFETLATAIVGSQSIYIGQIADE